MRRRCWTKSSASRGSSARARSRFPLPRVGEFGARLCSWRQTSPSERSTAPSRTPRSFMLLCWMLAARGQICLCPRRRTLRRTTTATSGIPPRRETSLRSKPSSSCTVSLRQPLGQVPLQRCWVDVTWRACGEWMAGTSTRRTPTWHLAADGALVRLASRPLRVRLARRPVAGAAGASRAMHGTPCSTTLHHRMHGHCWMSC